ncbi:TIGR04211 family SH3 domain-containing protein [Permianibacter aggregans]|uniref:SH3 domain protein n=1 Tax=Permianibacter aggregans TaxID=1510150 RepID=A0A4R6UMS4_9GAMM|nr:TIGR04211 family SH3 domain-containing protein [Permianibacter aggregans]QGX40241.1 TIGR04211 family SH3 domain-containing protein [Permianibacter aggregans]TDQ47496.1 SH3 domain protein [Permianibacter aggregans]
MHKGWMAMLLWSAAGLAMAAEAEKAQETFYISDQLTAPLRSGAAREQKIVNQLKAGEVVTVLEKAPGTGFLRVRSASGIEGWIEAERVVTEPPALVRFNALKRDFDAAAGELEWIKNNAPSQEQLQQQAHELQVRVVELENQIEVLTQQNSRLEERFQSEVLYAGALVMLAGLVLGWLVSAIKGKRRDGWH